MVHHSQFHQSPHYCSPTPVCPVCRGECRLDVINWGWICCENDGRVVPAWISEPRVACPYCPEVAA